MLTRLPLLSAPVPSLASAGWESLRPLRPVRYLRVVVVARCNLSCSFCHLEGDPAQPGRAGGLPLDDLGALIEAAIAGGIRKVKFLGGEPLLRADLPALVARLRQASPSVDLSMISAGAVDPARLRACYEAGLSRCNVSIHGWSADAFARRTRASNPRLHAHRQAFVGEALAAGRPLKLNYVYTGTEDEDDLGALLEWAAGKPLVVNVLDDLGQPSLGGADGMRRVVERLRGPAASSVEVPDPDSLPTTHLLFADGLRVELKDQRLGDLAPYAACASCPRRASCSEGILAWRLGHTGQLRPCLDREDLSLDLHRLWREQGAGAVSRLMASFARDRAN